MQDIICDLYVRVSTIEQAEEGYSLQAQEEKLRAYAAAQGWRINACHVDPGYSGAKLDRPGIQAVIEDARQHRINKVVTYKLDRLSRSQKDTLYLIEDVFQANHVDYVSMLESFDTGTPFGIAMIGLLSVFAQLERQQIAERMTMGRIASAKEGNWRGGSGVPIGYRYLPKTATEPGRLVVDPYEAQIVRDVFSQFLSGKTYHAIYEYCRGRYTTSYGSFAGGGANLIPSMLKNRAYIGQIKYSGQWYPGKHEPIIDLDTFQRAQDAIVAYENSLNEHKRKPYKSCHLLTGFLYCGECGARWCYHTCHYKSKSGEDRSYDTYTCYTKAAHKSQRKAERCSIPVWSASELEQVVWDQVKAIRYEDLQPEPDATAEQIKAIEKHIKDVDTQLARLVDLYSIGTLPISAVQEKAQELNDDKQRSINMADALRRNCTRPTEDALLDALQRVQLVSESDDMEIKRDLLRVLIKRIELLPDRQIRIEWNI